MKDQYPRPGTRRYAEERVAEIRRELAVGEDCSGTVPEVWRVLEEELLDELAELELALPKGEPGPDARRGSPAGRRRGRWRAGMAIAADWLLCAGVGCLPIVLNKPFARLDAKLQRRLPGFGPGRRGITRGRIMRPL